MELGLHAIATFVLGTSTVKLSECRRPPRKTADAERNEAGSGRVEIGSRAAIRPREINGYEMRFVYTGSEVFAATKPVAPADSG